MLARFLKDLFSRRAGPQAALPPAAAPAPDPAARSPVPAASRAALLSRLASFASGRELRLGAAEEVLPPSDTRLKADLPVAEIIAHATTLVADALDTESEARVARHVQAFERAARGAAGGTSLFVYHADMPAGERIDYVDARFNPGDHDYLDILGYFVARVRRHCPGATIYLATATGSRCAALAASDVAVVELEVDASRPMYERAAALLGYTRSAAFARDTVFLDADALVNRAFDDAFGLGFDVGLTYREGDRMMPVNEGVMFLSARRPAAVRDFLQRRLATYGRIAADPFITRYYGDVRRWRGGQLSLNALVDGLQPYSPYRRAEAAGAVLRFLPCDTFNFAGGEGEAPEAIERLAERYVLHFKGPRKYAFRVAAMARAGRGG